MKKIPLILLILSSPIFFISCDEDPDPEVVAQNEFLDKLAGTWVVEQASVDSKDVTDAFPGLETTFTTDKKLTVTNPVGNIWPASSTFELEKAGDLYDLLRDDEVLMYVDELSATTLVVRMTFSSPPGGRVSSTAGEYSFEMSKK